MSASIAARMSRVATGSQSDSHRPHTTASDSVLSVTCRPGHSISQGLQNHMYCAVTGPRTGGWKFRVVVSSDGTRVGVSELARSDRSRSLVRLRLRTARRWVAAAFVADRRAATFRFLLNLLLRASLIGWGADLS